MLNCNYGLDLQPPNVALFRALWSLFDGIWGSLKGSWGVLGIDTFDFGTRTLRET